MSATVCHCTCHSTCHFTRHSTCRLHLPQDDGAFLAKLQRSATDGRRGLGYWPIRSDRTHTALYCCSSYGPAFGAGFDFATMTATDPTYVAHSWNSYAEEGGLPPPEAFTKSHKGAQQQVLGGGSSAGTALMAKQNLYYNQHQHVSQQYGQQQYQGNYPMASAIRQGSTAGGGGGNGSGYGSSSGSSNGGSSNALVAMSSPLGRAGSMSATAAVQSGWGAVLEVYAVVYDISDGWPSAAAATAGDAPDATALAPLGYHGAVTGNKWQAHIHVHDDVHDVHDGGSRWMGGFHSTTGAMALLFKSKVHAILRY